MTKVHEFQELKRFIYNVKDYSSRLTGQEANAMIQDASIEALAKLDDDDRVWIEDLSHELQKSLTHLGEKGALELIAAMGCYLCANGNGYGHDRGGSWIN